LQFQPANSDLASHGNSEFGTVGNNCVQADFLPAMTAAESIRGDQRTTGGTYVFGHRQPRFCETILLLIGEMETSDLKKTIVYILIGGRIKMHQISVPEYVVAQVKSQRCKVNRYDRISGPNTALIVIDLQNVFMLPGMPLEVPSAREIVPNVNRLAGAVRKAGGKVVWVKMTLEGQTEEWSAFFDSDPRREALIELSSGSRGFELHADLDVRKEDTVLVKKRFSAFIQGSSDIDRVLRPASIDTVIITGTMTNVCCESSARDAMMLNYKVVFVADATAALSDAEHNATLTSMIRVFGDVRTTGEAVRMLSAKADA
jgi:ureidoacrylate peracid hydrolase